MFKFRYFDDRVKSMLSDKGLFWDDELKAELLPVLERLKQCGEIEGASCGFKPGVLGLVYELRGRTFCLTYAIQPEKREIKFYDFSLVSHEIDWKTALEQDCHMGENGGYYLSTGQKAENTNEITIWPKCEVEEKLTEIVQTTTKSTLSLTSMLFALDGLALVTPFADPESPT